MKSLYIHIPFCERKCFYCSFVVSIGQQERMDVYCDSLIKEAQTYKGSAFKTVYIGGGTPTFLSGVQLERLFLNLRKNFNISENTEWTIEANPEGIPTDKLKLLKNLGVNRISLGVQSLSDRYLKYLGRNHSKETAVRAYNNIREAGFDNVNVDLMFGFRNQSMEELKNDVNALTSLKSEHVSLYALTIEKDSRFYTQKVQLQGDEFQSNQYTLITRLLKEAGFKQYEVSNFAREGFFLSA